jgi:hypothetical protein
MESHSPATLSPDEMRVRQRMVLKVARSLGFIGRVEYRHVYSQTGGAQYGRGSAVRGDLLTVFAEAFDRDADPSDFSLSAMIAHERGHQLLARHPRLSQEFGSVTPAAEEVLASLLGAMLVGKEPDRNALVAKATAEVLAGAASAETAIRLIHSLWNQLEELL